MATATKPDTEEIASEVYALVDRIKPLRLEGKADGASELATEAEVLISKGLTGRSAAVTKLKITLRSAVAEALKTEPSVSTEVVLASAAEIVANAAEIDELVNKGVQEVANIADNKLNGPKRIAEIILDMWRRISLEDGTPDLMGTSALAKNKSKEIYQRVLTALPPKGESAAADEVRKEVTSLQRSVQNARITVRTEYVRSLNLPGAEADAERALFSGVIDPESDVSAADQVAAHYGFELKTHAEIMREQRAAKAAEAKPAAKAITDGTPVETLVSVVTVIRDSINSVPEISAAELDTLGAAEAEKVRIELEEQIKLLTELRAKLG